MLPKKHFDEKSGPLFKCDNIDRFCDTANAPSAMPPNLYYLGLDSTFVFAFLGIFFSSHSIYKRYDLLLQQLLISGVTNME